ncbi:helix-turn-helix domain-containing protein [Moraxella sp. ZY210820]|uniref:helix-turn-helix domain-containing protein n=1 Tax=unclassified Moraxella TaxID=2685852 RepID=UPI00273053F1|nr:helix-turn-helix domain-containing protein [Moraxella sp. ZY210820]WLF83174.1 DUF4115 domain-containing protein [Moraxella sp. ZY210820]
MEVTPNSAPMPDSTEPKIQQPGEYLAKIRKSKKLDLAQVAKDLTIPVKTLTALEQGDYQHLPEATFIKGFYRAYATYLQVDADEVVSSFDRVYTAHTGRATVQKLTDSPVQMKGKLASPKNPIAMDWKKWLGYAIALLIVLGIMTVIVKSVSSKKQNANTDNAQIEVIDLNTGTTTRGTTQVNAVEMSGEKLYLSFTRPTSVHIEDAKGKVLATGRQSNSLELTGQAPFRVRIDDATVATLRLNDENIDLSKRMVNGKVDFRLAR